MSSGKTALKSPQNFNPRPPWGGRRGLLRQPLSIFRFQSTPSVGRATTSAGCNRVVECISIHALRGEGDFFSSPVYLIGGKFQSTPSVGRATLSALLIHETVVISIHALRGEGDLESKNIDIDVMVISIHALRGEGDIMSEG